MFMIKRERSSGYGDRHSSSSDSTSCPGFQLSELTDIIYDDGKTPYLSPIPLRNHIRKLETRARKFAERFSEPGNIDILDDLRGRMEVCDQAIGQYKIVLNKRETEVATAYRILRCAREKVVSTPKEGNTTIFASWKRVINVLTAKLRDHESLKRSIRKESAVAVGSEEEEEDTFFSTDEVRGEEQTAAPSITSRQHQGVGSYSKLILMDDSSDEEDDDEFNLSSSSRGKGKEERETAEEKQKKWRGRTKEKEKEKRHENSQPHKRARKVKENVGKFVQQRGQRIWGTGDGRDPLNSRAADEEEEEDRGEDEEEEEEDFQSFALETERDALVYHDPAGHTVPAVSWVAASPADYFNPATFANIIPTATAATTTTTTTTTAGDGNDRQKRGREEFNHNTPAGKRRRPADDDTVRVVQKDGKIAEDDTNHDCSEEDHESTTAIIGPFATIQRSIAAAVKSVKRQKRKMRKQRKREVDGKLLDVLVQP